MPKDSTVLHHLRAKPEEEEVMQTPLWEFLPSVKIVLGDRQSISSRAPWGGSLYCERTNPLAQKTVPPGLAQDYIYHSSRIYGQHWMERGLANNKHLLSSHHAHWHERRSLSLMVSLDYVGHTNIHDLLKMHKDARFCQCQSNCSTNLRLELRQKWSANLYYCKHCICC